MKSVADTIVELMVEVSDGNPGAVTALAEMMNEDVAAIFAIHSSGLRGPQLWLAYKDYGKYDARKTLDAIQEKNERLVAVLDENGYPWVKE